MTIFFRVGASLILLHVLQSFFRGYFPAYEATTISSIASPLIVTIFSFWHGYLRYGWRKMLIFFLIVFATGWCYESLSIATGFPFGHYHYTDLLSGWIGNVPFVIMPCYFAFGYLAWNIGNILMGKKDNSIKGREVFLLPMISAFVMVLWDVTMDPIYSTITGYWNWHDGGVYFGVPISNYLGWYLCVFTFYFAFAFLNFATSEETNVNYQNIPIYWQLPVLMYSTFVFDYVGRWLGRTNILISSEEGHQWWTGDIYGAMVLISLFSVLPLVFYSLYRSLRGSSEPSQQNSTLPTQNLNTQ